ncbi:helix-turn-helix domain-containing protein [Gordonia sp. CPCC 206044]|uniref:PucR family transcriptional regulator n=1 Tax=Gordonia sp. CPCC 206044 TaxID=3140793 RepID=UPI003AF340F9
MATVGEVVDRAGLLSLTPGPADKVHRHLVNDLLELTPSRPLDVATGSVVYLPTVVWASLTSPEEIPGDLRSAGAVAVVIDTDDGNLLPEFVAACVSHSLPIYMLPRSSDVTDLRSIITKPAQVRDIDGSTSDLLRPLTATLDAFASESGLSVCLVMDGCLLASTPVMDSGLLTKTLALAPTPLEAVSTKSGALHLQLRDARYALALVNSRRRPIDRAKLHNAVRQIDAQVQTISVQRATRRGLEDALIRELIEAQAPSAALDPWVASFGLSPGDRVRALAVVFETDSPDLHVHVVAGLHDLGLVSGSSCVASTHHGIAYALIKSGVDEVRNPLANNTFDTHLKEFTDLFARRHDVDLAVGVSSYVVRSSDDLMRGLINARQLSERQARSVLTEVPEIPLPAPLAATLLADEPGLSDVLERALLQPVLDYDAEKGTSYVQTLRTFLALDGHWGATANELGIHSNTLRYRLSRVEHLTGRGLQSTADRSDYYLALCLRESAGHDQGPAA